MPAPEAPSTAPAGPGGGSAPPGMDFVPILVERIRRGQCVLLLGPGVVVDPAGQVPFAVQLARLLSADGEVRKTGLVADRDQDNLRYVAEVFGRARDPDELAKAAAGFYRAKGAATTDFHRNLAALPFTLCVNTSPDGMMAQAFREAGKQPRLAHYNFRRQVQDPAQGTEAEPLVYQLYGRADDLESLVLTESDLVDFLVAVVKNEPPLPGWMRALIGKRNTEFLFLGFGFQNWYLRVLLHVLGVMEAHERPSYALEDHSFFEHPECQQTVGFFRRSGGGIKFHELAWNEVAAQLRAAYEGAGAGEARPPGPPAGAPLAFLSYASEDEGAVSTFAGRLESRGIGVWQDRQRLRGGDRWEQALKHVIGKDVNYFLVVQSQAMTARDEGVFYEEIRWARDRQQRMPDDRRFVIPVTLDGRTLGSLKDEFHVVDLRAEAGVEQVARAILDDWAARRSPAAGTSPASPAG